MDPNMVTLTTMSGGAAEELFQEALKKCLENIDDPSTDPKAKRVINLQITISPDEERDSGKVEVACKTKLALRRPVTVRVHIGQHKGALAMAETFRQEELFDGKPAKPGLVEGTSR